MWFSNAVEWRLRPVWCVTSYNCSTEQQLWYKTCSLTWIELMSRSGSWVLSKDGRFLLFLSVPVCYSAVLRWRPLVALSGLVRDITDSKKAISVLGDIHTKRHLHNVDSIRRVSCRTVQTTKEPCGFSLDWLRIRFWLVVWTRQESVCNILRDLWVWSECVCR